MLLNKIISLSMAVVLLIPIFVSADCEEQLSDMDTAEQFASYLRQSLYRYMLNPEKSQINFTELNQTLKYFLEKSISASDLCDNSVSGDYGGVNITKIAVTMKKTNAEQILPECKDGTVYGECSSKKPYYCKSGQLVPMCAGPDENLTNVTDNCGCPSGAIECVEEIGQCDPECGYDGLDCLGTHWECDGEKVMEVTGDFDCVHYKCVETGGGSSLLFENCSLDEDYPYCYEGGGGASCVECETDDHCSDTTEYLCNGDDLQEYFYAGKCEMMGTPHCGFYGASVNTIDTCIGDKKCKDSCDRCFDLTTPSHEFWAADNTGSAGTMDYTVEFVAHPNKEYGTVGAEYYDFYKVELLEYKDGIQQVVADAIKACPPPEDCELSWDFNKAEEGNYTYKLKLYNNSLAGTVWTLPNFWDSSPDIIKEPVSGQCYGNITFLAESGT